MPYTSCKSSEIYQHVFAVSTLKIIEFIYMYACYNSESNGAICNPLAMLVHSVRYLNAETFNCLKKESVDALELPQY